ncbi:MAG: PH domain-containing protein [Pirellulales bacterium]|nr:PH domain-containing protein [Pirellulales bacterium]
MSCSNCKSELPKTAKFCPHCGQPLADQTGTSGSRAEIPPLVRNAAAADHPAARLQPGGGNRWNEGTEDDPETDVWAGTYSPKAMISTWVTAGLLTIVAFVAFLILKPDSIWWAWPVFLGVVFLVWMGLALRLVLQRLNVRYRLTTQRFVHEEGILRRVTDRIEVIDIDDVAVEQGLIDRLVGVGTVRLTSSDRTHGELQLKGIDNVQDVASKIDVARRRERVRRGLHIEAV